LHVLNMLFGLMTTRLNKRYYYYYRYYYISLGCWCAQLPGERMVHFRNKRDVPHQPLVHS